MPRSVLSFASFCAAASCGSAVAQSSTVENILKTALINPKSPKWAERGYLQGPFDVSSQKLPVNFKGHSTTQVQVALGNGDSPTKGKYETTAQYQARLRQTPVRSLFGKVQKSSPIAFSAAPSWVDYNADTQQMKVHFAFLEDEDSGLGIVTEAGSTTARKYTGTNGFGAQVEISERSQTSFGFSVTNSKDFWFVPIAKGEYEYEQKYRLTFNLPIPLKSAPRFENAVRALFIGYIAPPEKGIDLTDYHKATFDSPYETSSWRHYACLRVKSVWLYDTRTGFIYAKMNPKS